MTPGAEQAHAARNCSIVLRLSLYGTFVDCRLHDATLFRLFAEKKSAR